MLGAAEPAGEALEAKAEAGVGDATVFAQVKVPFERLSRKIVFF